jgi:hypothetical protein
LNALAIARAVGKLAALFAAKRSSGLVSSRDALVANAITSFVACRMTEAITDETRFPRRLSLKGFVVGVVWARGWRRW